MSEHITAALGVSIADFTARNGRAPTPLEIGALATTVAQQPPPAAPAAAPPAPQTAAERFASLSRAELEAMDPAERRKLFDAERGRNGGWTNNSPYTKVLPKRMRG